MPSPDSPLLQLMQVFFYGGLLVLFVGLPIFIFLWIRLMRDVHQITKALWAIHYQMAHQAPQAAAPQPVVVKEPARVANSQFGR